MQFTGGTETDTFISRVTSVRIMDHTEYQGGHAPYIELTG